MSAEDRTSEAGDARPETGPRPLDPLVGSTLKGTYKVLRKVAEGGMGRVYEGEHTRLGRRVAIKVLLARYAQHPEVLQRFQREAQVVGGLGHPHIVQVIDVDETDAKEPFLVMEFLEGETLHDRLTREPRLPMSTVLRIVSQVASALSCTHERNIVHRDLKPENVFLVHAIGEKDFVKVLDFGVSKVRTAGPRLTAKNVVIGTPSYMAPEQARADRDVDARADQFALAAMVYEMLSGMRPFAGEEAAEVLLNVLTVGAPELTQVAPWVPEGVAQVIHKGLAKDPGDRYGTITDFAAALEMATASAGRSVTVPPKSSAQPEATPEKPNVEIRAPEPAPAPRPRIFVEGRTPPAPEAAHLIEHIAPLARGGTPGARRLPSAPTPPEPVRAQSRPAPSGSEGPVSQRRPQAVPQGSRPPSNPAPTTPAPTSAPPISGGPLSERSASRAEQLFQALRTSMRNGRVDDAVLQAEKLLEHAIIGKDPAIYEVLRRAMPFVEHVFDTRVGPVERKLEVTALGREPEQLNLSPKALTLLALANGLTVQELLERCGVPRRDAVRMLAGLLRRRALIAV